VPAEEDHLWTFPPFQGVVAGSRIWGRGAMDDKYNVLALLEASEILMKKGYQPERSLYFAFGHDEEVSGYRGARHIGELLEKRQLEFEFLLDEGTPLLTDPLLPGLNLPVALVGLSEKGWATLALKVNGTGGHSSAPPDHTAIGILSQAIVAVERNPLPPKFDGPARLMVCATP